MKSYYLQRLLYFRLEGIEGEGPRLRRVSLTDESSEEEEELTEEEKG